MQMRLQRLIQTQAQRRRANKMANENPVAQSGKQAIGSWLKSKGTAIGVAVGVALTSLGDYLLGRHRPYCLCNRPNKTGGCVLLMRKLWQFVKDRVRLCFERGRRGLKIFKVKIRF